MNKQNTPKGKGFLKKRGVLELSIVVILSVILIVFFNFYNKANTEEKPKEIKTDSIVYIPKVEYGIIIDSLNVYKGTVKQNQNLSEILTEYNVEYPIIDNIARNWKDVFDVRRMRTGNEFTVICEEIPNDSTEKTLYFIYEISPREYVVYDLRDSVIATKGEKPIIKEIKTARGVITSSLWKAMYDNGTDPELALSLSEVYAWTIDFYGIQKNDQYKVIYEALSVGDKYIGVGNVYGAWFNHMGKDFYAIHFEQDSIIDFFDDEGGSMRRTFLRAPLRFTRISSRYSHSRLHPILKYRRPHHGVDYAAPKGTPVRAVGDGIVVQASYSGGAGNIVKIKHNGTYSTAYMHLWKFGKGVKAGVHVSQGQVIGYVGNSGLSTGPHLDFRFYRNGAAIDPLKVESPPAEPVDSANIDAFMLVRDSIVNILDQIEIELLQDEEELQDSIEFISDNPQPTHE